MIRGVGPYSALITPQAGSLFHAVFQNRSPRASFRTTPVPDEVIAPSGPNTSCLFSGPVIERTLQPFAQCPQHLRAVPAPSRAMHTSQSRGPGLRQPLDHRGSVIGVRIVVHLAAEGFARIENVGFRKWGMLCAALGKKITAKERLRSFFRQEPALPGVGQVRRRKPTHSVPTEREDFSVIHRMGSTIGYIADRNDRGDLAAERYGVGCDTEKVVERAASSAS